jgi:hypothetical protein
MTKTLRKCIKNTVKNIWQTVFSFLPLLENFYQPKAIIGWHFVSTFICKWGCRADMKNSTQCVGWKIKKLDKKISMGNKWEVFNIFFCANKHHLCKIKLSKCKCIVIKDGYGLHAARVPPDWHAICRASNMNNKTGLSKSFCCWKYCIIVI